MGLRCQSGLDQLPFTFKVTRSILTWVFSVRLKPSSHVKRVISHALLKIVSFPQVPRFSAMHGKSSG